MITLYPPQQAFIDHIRAAMVTSRNILAQAPTGFGKSICFSYIAQNAAAKGKRVLLIVPRRELIRQMTNLFNDMGVRHSFIAAGYPYEREATVHIGSLNTVIKRLGAPKQPDMVIIDEAHFGGKSLNRIIEFFKLHNVWVLGFSATPKRLGGEGFDKYYDKLICGPSVRWLIDNKYLSDYRLFAPSKPDLEGIKVVAGDYAKEQLATRMEADRVLIGNAVEHYKRHAMGKLCIAYCTGIKHSEIVAQAFNNAGIPAAHMDGNTPDKERIRIINDYADRKILVLTNCDLLTFGFDLASQVGRDITVECMSDLRPTVSLALQMQKWGRVLRYKPFPALIFDHAGNWERHGIPCQEREWVLEGKKKRETESAIAVRQCLACHHVHKVSPSCPNCGYVYAVKIREVEEQEGELEEILDRKAKRMEVGRAQTLEELKAIAKERGYKPAWAYYVLKARQRRGG